MIIMRILLDTNIILDAIKFHVDIISEAQKFGEPFTLDICLNELKRIAEKGKGAIAAKIAMQFARKLPIIEAQGAADRAILSYSIRHRCGDATNDKKLIKALKLKGIRVIRLRQKSYLVAE